MDEKSASGKRQGFAVKSVVGAGNAQPEETSEMKKGCPDAEERVPDSPFLLAHFLLFGFYPGAAPMQAFCRKASAPALYENDFASLYSGFSSGDPSCPMLFR